MDEANIPIEEEIEISKEKGAEWTEEISVAGGQLIETIQALLREAVVRKISVVDKQGKTLIDIPLYAGIIGVALLGYWSVLALIAAWFTEVSIRIVREDMPADADVEETASLGEIAGRAGTAVSEAASRAGSSLGEMAARASKAASEMAARAADSIEHMGNGNGHAPVAVEETVAEAEPQRCQATTKAGTQCKRNAMPGSDYCSIHQE